METKNVDVVVIGSGVAGAVAAARALDLGLKVMVVSKSQGATAYSSGAVDLADEKISEVPSSFADPLQRGESWFKSAQRLMLTKIHHPYARMGQKVQDIFEEALALFLDLSKDISWSLREDQHNHVLTTQMGTLKRCAMVPRTMLCEVASFQKQDEVGVVGLDNFKSFDPGSVVRMLNWILKLSPQSHVALNPFLVSPSAFGMRHWKSTFEAASDLDQGPNQDLFIQALKAALREAASRVQQLWFPPLLGISKTEKLIQKMEKALEVKCKEMLAMPHSVPGLRLAHALSDGLSRRGAVQIKGTLKSYEIEQRCLKNLTLMVEDKRTLTVHAKKVILATGRALGGGMLTESAPVDSVFNLPLWTSRGPVGDRYPIDMTSESIEKEQEIFSMGLAYDDSLRPLDACGEVFATNLFAAGSILQGYDPAKEGTGMGVGILTGYIAAG